MRRPRSEFGMAWVMITSAKLPDECHRIIRGTVEIDPAVVVGAAGELPRIALGRAFDEHALPAAHHAFGDGARLTVEALLQEFQPLLLDLVRHLVRQRRGRSAGPAAVDEAERLIEARLRHEIHGREEILSPFRREIR